MATYPPQQLSLSILNQQIPLSVGTRIYANEISVLRSQSGDGVVAEVTANPNNPSVLGLQNRSYQAWTVISPDGTQQQVLPSQNAKLSLGTRINFVSVQGEVCVSQIPISNKDNTSPPPVDPYYSREPIYTPAYPPVNPVPYPVYPANYSYPPRYAGFWLRFVAIIIDSIIVSILSFVFSFILWLVFGVGNMSEDEQTTFIGYLFLLSAVVNWLYFAFMESSTKQATLGKMALGIIVTDMNYNRISFGKATARYFGKIVSALFFYSGFFMAGFTEKKQALHDLMAGCLVLTKK